jgi:acetoin utilization deacetylase AcuC-like enzyme
MCKVVAIDYLVTRGRCVAYFAIDTHHGDGVQSAYYRTDLDAARSAGYPHNSGRLLRDAPHRSGWNCRERAWQEAERVVEYLKVHVFPLVRCAQPARC